MKVSWEIQALEGIFPCISAQIWSNIPLWYRDLNGADNKYIKEGTTALEFTPNFSVNWKNHAFALEIHTALVEVAHLARQRD